MQTRAKIFDDIAKVTGGAVSTLNGIKEEVENIVRQQIERILVDADVVPREEFEILKKLVQKQELAIKKLTKKKTSKKVKKS